MDTRTPERWSVRLSELGIALPAVPAAVASYVPAVQCGSMVYTSGQLPFQGSALASTGKVGAEVSENEATDLARLCALNALAAASAIAGLDNIARIVKVVGFVNSAPGFHGQAAVVNGASDLLADIFGQHGAHARSAVGVAELPLDAPVEVELILEIGVDR